MLNFKNIKNKKTEQLLMKLLYGKKTSIMLNKPIYGGFVVLELS